MPFNGSGVYDLPQPPVVGGTVIATSWANPTLNDIKAALSNCLVRDGQAAMTGTLLMGSQRMTGLADGAVGTPAIAFAASTTTGIYSPGSGQFAITAAGTQRMVINGAAIGFTGNVSASGTLGVGGLATIGGDLTVTGKKLSSQPRFYARRTSTQTSGTVPIFDTEDYDVGPCFNNTTSVFTAPFAGTYAISVSMAIWNQNAGAVSYGYYLKLNGATVVANFDTPTIPADSIGSTRHTLIIHLAANDTLQIEAQAAFSGGGGVLYGGTTSVTRGQCYFAGVLIG